MELHEAMRTTFAAREFTGEPLPDAALARILDHARSSQAIWNPTPNCYRRIRPKTYAPSNISWGVQDRSASVRVKASRDQSQHLEVRVPSAMANPYLVAASVIAAGLLGVTQKRELTPAAAGPKEDDDRFEKLPTSIMPPGLQALLSQDDLVNLVEYLSSLKAKVAKK